MTHKKGKFMTFLFSLLPGAGEMYLGFMKQGSSIMVVSFALVAISGFLDLGGLLFFTPVLWFYSFFNTNNLNSLPDEEFYSIDDDYFIHPARFYMENKFFFQKYRVLISAVIIFLGVMMIWNNVFDFLYSYFQRYFIIPQPVMVLLNHISTSLPQTVAAIAIILFGIYLIRGKKKELEDHHKS